MSSDVPTDKIVSLPKATQDMASSCDSGLFDRFQRSFSTAPHLTNLHQPQPDQPSTQAQTHDTRPHISFPRQMATIPPTPLPLHQETSIPLKIAQRFTHKETLLYMHLNTQVSGLSRSLFKEWYPHREIISSIPDPDVDAPLDPNVLAGNSNRPTPPQAALHLFQAFCTPVKILDAPEEGVPLVVLVEVHEMLVGLFKRALESGEGGNVVAGPYRKGWANDMMKLNGGLQDGFVVLEAGQGDANGVYLRIVGREMWVEEGWGEEDLGNWQLLDGISGSRWYTRAMKLEDAVRGVLRANGDGGPRATVQDSSDWFRNEFT